MTFKLSAFAPYKSAMLAKQAGDFAIARTELKKCIEAARTAGGDPTVSGLLFWLGDVEALDGRREAAMQMYDEALAVDPGSPLALICYAESLFHQLAEPALALEKLQDAEALLSSGRWRATEDDLTQAQYMHRITEVRARLLSGV